LNARRAQIDGTRPAIDGAGLSKYLIKPCVFVHSMKMTAQKLHKHNTSNLQKTFKNLAFIYALNAQRAQIGGTWLAIGGAGFSKYLIKPYVSVHLMKITTQKLHKHNTSNLQKSL